MLRGQARPGGRLIARAFRAGYRSGWCGKRFPSRDWRTEGLPRAGYHPGW